MSRSSEIFNLKSLEEDGKRRLAWAMVRTITLVYITLFVITKFLLNASWLIGSLLLVLIVVHLSFLIWRMLHLKNPPTTDHETKTTAAIS